MITHRCNARCTMCNLWCEPEKDTEIDIYINLIKSSMFKNIVNVAVTGGELTLRTDLSPFFQALLTHCPQLSSINLSSNAFLSDPLLEIVTELVRLRNAADSRLKIIVQISMDGPGIIHKRIRGVSNGFEKVQKSIDMLNQAFTHHDNIEIRYLCVLQPDNLCYLEEITHYFNEITIPVTYNMICDASYLKVDPDIHPVLDSAMKKQLIAFFQELVMDPKLDPGHRYHYSEFIEWLKTGIRKKSCGMLTQHILVDHRGQMLPCLNARDYKYPEINEQNSIQDIWKGSRRRQINRQLK